MSNSSILELRKDIIYGKVLDLIPIRECDLEAVLTLRNKPRNRYGLNQQTELSPEDQLSWYRNYLDRDNDIYWCIFNKQGTFVGTIRLYDIDFDSRICEEGSFIIDEEHATDAPYAVESKMLALDIAFDRLGMETMINENRADNKNMNNLSKQLGFKREKEFVLRGVDYLYLMLSKDDYIARRSKLQTLVDYWSNR